MDGAKGAVPAALPPFRLERTDALIPYANNARTHSDAQVAKIAGSIKQFGFTNPILVDAERGIIAGHGRVRAARLLGITEVPVIELAHLSPAQRQAYILADNRLALDAGWDDELLRVELSALRELEFDISLIGFEAAELDALFAQPVVGLTEPDDVPPLADPISIPDDVWLLGRHRLVCGDSTMLDTVTRCLNGARPHLMVTDPPYGVEYDPDWRNRADRANGKPIGARAVGKVQNDDRADWRPVWALFPGDVAYCWHAGVHASETQLGFEASGFEVRAQIIWAKQQFVISRGHYHIQHEPCFYLVRKATNGHWCGDRKQTTVWEIDKPRKSETGHSTQKPVECMQRPIKNNSVPGDSVYEPFSGSGTTIIAAEITGRTCLAIEIEPAYVDVAVRRWQAFTGQEALLEGGGTFAAVEAERAPRANVGAASAERQPESVV